MRNAVAESLISRMDPRAPEAEAYRELRTSIQFSSIDRPIRSIVVTSSGQDEGKSTTAANLAIAVAQVGRRVILCDADLRRPCLHALFGLPNHLGLSSVVLGAPLEEALQHTEVGDLLLLASGPVPPNPAELLGSQRMESVIEDLARRADYVVFDTPPVGLVTDGAELASRADLTLLVISSGKTRRDEARRAKDLLEKVRAPLVRAVLNQVKPAGRDRYHYRYQQ